MGNLPNPFAAVTSWFSNIGASWGSGQRDVMPSSADQFMSIDAQNRMLNRGTILPGYGPSVPSMTLGTVTNAIPGAIYDSGFPVMPTVYANGSNGFLFGAFPGAAARATTDLNAWPYPPQAADTVPITIKLKQWWSGVTSTFSHPSDQVDGAKPAASNKPALLTVAVIGAVGIVGAIAFAKR